jgi:hypothetical protein
VRVSGRTRASVMSCREERKRGCRERKGGREGGRQTDTEGGRERGKERGRNAEKVRMNTVIPREVRMNRSQTLSQPDMV